MPEIYPITGAADDQAGWWARLERLAGAGHDLIQLRPAPGAPESLREMAAGAQAMCAPAGVGLVLNGPPRLPLESMLRLVRDLHLALQKKACDLVMPDFMRIGGVTGWMRAQAIAAAAGVPVSTHLYPEVAAQVMRVTETAHWLEWQNWADPILQQPYEVKEGWLHVPDVPGVGLEWNEGAVAANLADL